VLIPRSQGQLASALQSLGEVRLGGKKVEERVYKGVQVDLYFATPETWHTLLLIRTGSKAHNIKLTTLTKKKGWHLYASGRGLFNEKGERIAGDTEWSFFEALGLPYAEPWERER
jgi:DNA polymerase/3'-5' exonuclease PolX